MYYKEELQSQTYRYKKPQIIIFQWYYLYGTFWFQ